MSRLNIENDVYDDGISEIISDLNAPKEDKVVIIDGDSLPYICGYQPKYDEFGKETVLHTLENGGYDIVEGYLEEKILEIYNNIEKYFTIKKAYICVKGKNNPRHKWLESYKSHRTETPAVVKHLQQVLITKYNAFVAPIGEADDSIYSISKTINNEGIICGIDKDLKNIPSIHYSFTKKNFTYVDYKNSRLNFWTQVLVGDSVDFKGLSPSIGIKYAQKNLSIDFTEEQYKEAVFLGYMKAWKNNEKLAQKNMDLCYKLVKLWDIEELTKFNNK